MNTKTLIVLCLLLILVLLYFACAYRDCKRFFLPKNDAIPTTPIAYRKYASQNLHFSIKVPSRFIIQERFNTVILTSSTGAIEIDKVGTYYDKINDYLNYLSLMNNVKIENRKTITIHGFSAMSGIIKHPSNGNLNAKMYFIASRPSFLFTFSTTTPSLYNDLDSIAESFEYTP